MAASLQSTTKFPSLQSAENAAMKEIIESFPNSDKLLQRIRSLRLHYQNEKMNVDEKLGTLVQGRLNESKLALQLLQKSCDKTKDVCSNFNSISKSCEECKKLLPDYNIIKQVSKARQNLSLTIRLLKTFRSIPEKATQLFDEIKKLEYPKDENESEAYNIDLKRKHYNSNSPLKIKLVYVQLRKLIYLKQKALEEGVMYDSALSNIMTEHFSILKRLARKLEACIQANIHNALDLACYCPEILVQTLIIIEMEDDEGLPIFNESLLQKEEEFHFKQCNDFSNNSHRKLSNSLVSRSNSRKLNENDCKNKFESENLKINVSSEPFSSLSATLSVSNSNTQLNHKSNNESLNKISNKSRSIKRHSHSSTMPENSSLKTSLSMHQRCIIELEKAMAERFGQCFRNDSYKKSSEIQKSEAVSDLKPQNSLSLKSNKTNISSSKSSHNDVSSDATIKNLLSTASNLVNDLDKVYHSVAPCFPPKYKIFEFYESRYQKWLYSHFQDQVSHGESISPAEILEVVDQIEKYNNHMSELGIFFNETDLFVVYSSQLLEEYLEKIKKTVIKQVDNIIERERQVQNYFEIEDNVPKTHSPQDLFSSTNQLVSVALDKFRGKAFVNAIYNVTNILEYFQQQQLNYLNDDDILKKEEQLCAFINNYEGYSDEVEQLKESCFKKYNDAKQDMNNEANSFELNTDKILSKNCFEFSEIENELDSKLNKFALISKVAVEKLSENIMKVLDQNVMSHFFTKQWFSNYKNITSSSSFFDSNKERNEHFDSSNSRSVQSIDVLDELVATLGDFFDDFTSWIVDDFYRGRLITLTLENLVKKYCRAFISRPVLPKKLLKQESLSNIFAENIRRDKEHLMDFFCEKISIENERDLVPKRLIISQFEYLNLICDLLTGEKGFLSIEFERLERLYEKNSNLSIELFEAVLLTRNDIDKLNKNELLQSFCQFVSKKSEKIDETVSKESSLTENSKKEAVTNTFNASTITKSSTHYSKKRDSISSKKILGLNRLVSSTNVNETKINSKRSSLKTRSSLSRRNVLDKSSPSRKRYYRRRILDVIRRSSNSSLKSSKSSKSGGIENISNNDEL